MSQSMYLIDANSLITPYRNYYSFDFARGFWTQMEHHIREGNVALLDVVKDEILRGNDELTDWLKGLEIGRLIDHREAPILVNYGQVLQFLQNNPYYRESALAEWSRNTVADPWLIAAAQVYNCSIVTFEIANSNPDIHNPWKMAKIPNVASEFGIVTVNLFSMMRALNIRL